MKKVFMIAGALFVSVLAMGQTASNKVQEAFSEEKIQQLKQEDSEKLDYWNFYADRVFVYNENRKPGNEYPDISTLEPKSADTPQLTAETFDPSTFNPLLYDIDLKDKELQYYQIGENGGMIMIYSQLRFDVLFERHQANNK